VENVNIDKKASYLVTGGAGFIGSNIVSALVKEGCRIRVLDNLSTGHIENISEHIHDIDFIQGDIRDLETVRQAMKGIDYVLHEAALPSVPRSVADPVASVENNINGTLNVLVAARDAGIKRLTYASSSSVYGDTEVLPKTEDLAPKPLSPYATAKLAGEHLCGNFYRLFGLETVALRYFNVFGPRQDPTSQYAAVIPIFMSILSRNESPQVYGDGEQTRDFTYVQNVVSANLLACVAPNAPGEVMNIACGERISLNQLLSTVNKILETNIQPTYVAPRPGDVKDSLADISKARSILGYRPSMEVREGLQKLVVWNNVNRLGSHQ
jgi:nucleoside-diphosphate-sugar epimerase